MAVAVAKWRGVLELEVTLLNRQRGRRVSAEPLTGFLDELARTMPATDCDSVVVVLVSDRKIHELNRRYRGRNSATDVLSFPTGDAEGPPGERHLGDIVISVATAAEQARRARHSLERELCVLMLHGYLHLLGYDHQADDGAMLRLQEKLARKLIPA